MSVAVVETKTFDHPDETRPFVSHGQVQLVNIGGRVVGLGTFEPGWRWRDHVGPLMGTELCETAHFGVVKSGRMVILADGIETQIVPGMIVMIPPGHDAWVPPDDEQPCVFVDFGPIEGYAKP